MSKHKSLSQGDPDGRLPPGLVPKWLTLLRCGSARQRPWPWNKETERT